MLTCKWCKLHLFCMPQRHQTLPRIMQRKTTWQQCIVICNSNMTCRLAQILLFIACYSWYHANVVLHKHIVSGGVIFHAKGTEITQITNDRDLNPPVWNLKAKLFVVYGLHRIATPLLWLSLWKLSIIDFYFVVMYTWTMSFSFKSISHILIDSNISNIND